jgi:hypothetical protein
MKEESDGTTPLPVLMLPAARMNRQSARTGPPPGNGNGNGTLREGGGSRRSLRKSHFSESSTLPYAHASGGIHWSIC